MAQKRITKTGNEPLRAALDIGNGEVAGVSNERPYDPLTFEPIVAPATKKRGLDDSRPTMSLYRPNAKENLVFGIDDVYAFGQRDMQRRLTGMTRYTHPDYVMLADVLLLNLFGSKRGTPDRISPTLAINLPVDKYNDETTSDDVKSALAGKRDIMDIEKCALQLDLDADRIIVLPESTGALMHWAFDPQTLERRANTGGTTLVIDIGFETTDTTLFEGMKYQRERAYTLDRAGMYNVAATIADALVSAGELAQSDYTRIDRALRPLANTAPTKDKYINLHKEFEVSELYDSALSNLAFRISQFVQTRYTENTTRVVLAGGGAYHLMRQLKDMLPAQYGTVERAPDAAHANVLGAYTTLRIREQRR